MSHKWIGEAWEARGADGADPRDRVWDISPADILEGLRPSIDFEAIRAAAFPQYEWSADERMCRLLDMGQQWFLAIDAASVNLDDVTSIRPGGIVRCRTPPGDAVRIFHIDAPELGCVAGWISDEE